MKNQMKFNNEIAKFSLYHNLHVEYLIWIYLKSCKHKSYYTKEDLHELPITQSLLCSKLKNNNFYNYNNDKIYLKSVSSLPVKRGKIHNTLDSKEMLLMMHSLNAPTEKKKTNWSATKIKKLMLSIVACQYGEYRPYALSLISKDTNCSEATIKRALSSLYVEKKRTEQQEKSNCFFHQDQKRVYISANYNVLNIGKKYIKKS